MSEISVSIKLDNGFMRRTCPHCGRDFKWRHTEAGQSPYPPVTVYHCPYCGEQGDEWNTAAQSAYFRQQALSTVSEEIGESLRDLERTVNEPGGLINVEVTVPSVTPSGPPPAEPNDMMEVEPPCHPLEPLKIDEEWSDLVHCLMCGETFDLK